MQNEEKISKYTETNIEKIDVSNSCNIGFIIGTFGHGRGGHFWDLKIIADKISESQQVVIFNIGIGISPVLETSNVKVINVPLGLCKALTTFQKAVNYYNIDKLVSIDLRVNIIPSLISKFFKIPLILVKPGGPNPGRNYPIVKELIVFSLENFNYFKEKTSFNETLIHFLPNRSMKSEVNIQLVNEIRKCFVEETFKFVQVIRITEEYFLNLCQSIELIRLLNDGGKSYSSTLIIIGVVQNQKVYEDIKKLAVGLPIYFFTENKYTAKASELLTVGDAVIANGRSVMEGASLGLPILVSAKNSKHPVLLKPENFKNAFKVNFSPRFEIDEIDSYEENNILSIQDIINDADCLAKSKGFSIRCFNDFFNIDKVIVNYIDIIKNSKYKGLSLWSLFLMFKIYVFSRLRIRFNR
ncbi:hypothetical protein [Shewanella sp. AC34-MNA-CIBAN-0136]|uniref:hypothetical protein n=1 Tax=Shewanella sp. AC34-MNA-CIBAN-0136 TaxID=3140463 RepID=UPI003332F4D0